ncbi:precorrin-6A/cobalt-precorrin-6A reductase [uncultured Marivita sp.]|uniref:precorrin-6A/cobalt-precorrin-6A reductase n=1 Tax=uncultured Marivita sp. TaxID=888080 RepID=UPI0026229910|nr:precorrin-6A/cobalt-precorrin-6A reductase [uncultured Marivita sp.]
MKDSTGAGAAEHAPIAILGGSAEARVLAERLGNRARLWLPRTDRVSGQRASRLRDVRDLLTGASAIIIAPHPCDVDTLRLGAQLAKLSDLPKLTLSRPAWRPTRLDRWVTVRSAKEAAAVIPAGARVLVTLGRPALRDLRAMRNAHLFVRQLNIHSEAFSLKHGRYLHGVAPFTIAQEIALMRTFRIDAVLTRNAGGPGGWPKIAAARALGLPVYMVARPRVDTGPVATSVEAALDWLEARTWLDA